MIQRRDFLSTLLAPYFAARTTNPDSAVQPSTTLVPKKPEIPWTFKFTPTDAVSETENEFTREKCYVIPAGTTVQLFYRGNLFCTLDATICGLRTVIPASVYAPIAQLFQDYSATMARYLWHTSAHFNAIVQYMAKAASEQREMRSWPLEDTVAFRGDPIGHLLYDLRDKRQCEDCRREEMRKQSASD